MIMAFPVRITSSKETFESILALKITRASQSANIVLATQGRLTLTTIWPEHNVTELAWAKITIWAIRILIAWIS